MKAISILLPLLGLALLLILPLDAAAVAGDTLIQKLDNGCIDWSTGAVRVRGVGVPTAAGDGQKTDSPDDILDIARRMAQTNLLDTVKTIRINADSVVADRVARSTDFRDGLVKLARNASVTRQEYLSDGTLEIELTMKLIGGFGQFVLPEEIRQVDPVTTVTVAEPTDDTQPTQTKINPDGPYTGLIVDASGIGAKPALVPVVVDESEEVVYGPAFVSREFAVSRGMSGFATTLAAARADKRVGDRPMIVKAIRTRSARETDLVISTTDAARLRSSVVHLNFLKACRVSIVIDLADDL